MDFKQPYDRAQYLLFLKTQLLPEDFVDSEERVLPSFQPQFIQNIFKLGEVPSLDLCVYEAAHPSEYDPRVSLSRDTFRLMAQYGKKRALVFFVSKNSHNFRFSLVTIDLKWEEGKRVQKEYSNPRRYSFFLGFDAKTHTPETYLTTLGRVKDFEDLKKRFSIEVVNKDFYTKIAILFTQLAGGRRKSFNAGNGDLKLPSTNDDTLRKEFTVRLIGRLVFCWFLKKKKSHKGLTLLTENLLSMKAVEQNKGYYHSILESLFFEVLNTPIEKRNKKYKSAPWDQIPFLNGGLFNPHTHDFYDPEIVGNLKHINTLKIPDGWFKDLFAVFETYNFTIDENTSVDVELSIEPEMLGRIFENLLAEINPETGETARKATGSYYTPRPIVEYMVDESLKQYLLTKTTLPGDIVSKLLTYDDLDVGLGSKEKEAVVEALDMIKIIDPACGSGAFPMGILQKMLLILQKVDPDSQSWLDKKLASINDAALRKGLKAKLKADNFNYIHKLGIIRDAIYGVDIQPIAVEISKLRFFLSLIVDEKVNDTKENRGIEPLPNLEFKFICANSLIGLPQKNTPIVLFESNKDINSLKVLRDEYLRSYGDDKKRIEKEFQEVQTQMFKKSLTWGGKDSKTLKLAEWKPFSEDSCPWFDPEWMFGVTDGFDIVIGNPPYIAIQRMEVDNKKRLQNIKFKTFENTGDIYVIFYEKGQHLLKNKGVLSYITSRQWMQASYGKSLRKFLADETNPLQLIDFGQAKIFEGATVFVNILLFEKAKNQNNLLVCLIPTDYDVEHGNLATFFTANMQTSNKLTENTWTVSNSQHINEHIERVGTPIKNWREIEFYAGIKTALNDAYHIRDDTKTELINRDPKNSEIIKPLLRGKDIKRYRYNYENWYMLNIHNGVREVGLPRVDVAKDYPSVYDHLKKWQPQLEERLDKGDHWTNLRNCAFLLEFEKPKIVWIEISNRANYAYDDKGMYLTNSAYFLTCKSDKANLKYLLAILNSKVADFYFMQKTARIAGGRMRYTKQYVEQIPVPEIPLSEQRPFISLVNYILFLKTLNPQAVYFFESLIENMVYELYFPDEIKAADCEVLKHLTNLPELKDGWSDEQKLKTIEKVYKELYDPAHPASVAMEKMKTVPEVRIIEGLDKK